MDVKKEFEDLKKRFEELKIELEKEKLPFQEELDTFADGGRFKVVEAICSKVVLQGSATGTEIKIDRNGRIVIEKAGMNSYNLALLHWKRLVKLAEAVADCHDC